jgi:hypothetical protein
MPVITRTFTRTHTYITFANPYLVCDTCGRPVARFHNHERCGCGMPEADRYECRHLGERSLCPSWNPVDGCTCLASLGHVPHGPAPEVHR